MDLKEDFEHLVHPDKKHEHQLVIVASILTIILFVMYLRNQATAAQAAAAGTSSGSSAAGSSGGSSTGSADTTTTPTSTDLSGYTTSAQEQSDVSGLQTELTTLQSQFQTALNGLASTITATPPAQPSFSFSVSDTGTSNHDAAYTSGILSGASNNVGAAGGSGGILSSLTGGLGSIFGSVTSSGSSSTNSNWSDIQNAETGLDQTISATATGYDSGTIGSIISQIVGLTNNAITAVAAPTTMPGNANANTPFWVTPAGTTYHQDANNIFTTSTAPGGTNKSGGIVAPVAAAGVKGTGVI